MTLPEELVEAAAEAKCLNHIDGRLCGVRNYPHPECAIAAVLRALPESEESRNAIALALDDLLDPEECVDATFIALAAIAKLADDE